jgi:CheY-like chemotaxis protein
MHTGSPLGRRAKLTGTRVLVVEDEIFASMLVEDELRDAGATVLGPAPSVGDALRLVEAAAADGGISAAVLDINLDGRHVAPVADRLAALGVPFVFATGYGENHDTGGHGTAPTLPKPFGPERLIAAVERLLATHAGVDQPSRPPAHLDRVPAPCRGAGHPARSMAGPPRWRRRRRSYDPLASSVPLDRPDPLEAALNRHSATFPEAGLCRSCAASAALVAALAAGRCRGRWGCGTARWRRTNRWAAGPSRPRSTSADRRMARSPAENPARPATTRGSRA